MDWEFIKRIETILGLIFTSLSIIAIIISLRTSYKLSKEKKNKENHDKEIIKIMEEHHKKLEEQYKAELNDINRKCLLCRENYERQLKKYERHIRDLNKTNGELLQEVLKGG